MKLREIGYALGCMLLVGGLMMFSPSMHQSSVEVNETLLAQAEEQGLLEAELPVGAKNAVGNGCEVDGVLAGEITFELREVEWTYRCAAIAADGEAVPDISDVEGDFTSLETQVQHCPAIVYVSEDGVGKIVWYDVVPGVAYSLSMAENADGDTLQSIANLMFTPLQGDT